MKNLIIKIIAIIIFCQFYQQDVIAQNTAPAFFLQEKTKLAKTALDAKDWDKAISLYKELVKANPTDKANINYLAQSYNGATSDLTKSEREVFFTKEILFATSLINQNNRVPLLLSFRSVLYDWLGDAKGTIGNNEYTNGINDLTAAIKLKPEEALYYFKRAKIYQYKFLNKTDAAFSDVNKAISLGDKYNSYILLATIFKTQKKYQQAIETYDKAISITTDKQDIAQLYSLRGDAHKDMNENVMAKEDYNKAIGFYPERMDFKKKRDDLNVSTTGLETANISPNLINVTDVSSSITGGAEYNKLVETATEFVWGFSKTKEKNLDKAILYSTEAIRLFPNVWHAYLTRAQAYSKAGKVALSEKDVTKAKDLADSRAGYIDRAMAAAEGRTYIDETTNNTSSSNNSNSEPASTSVHVCTMCHGKGVRPADAANAGGSVNAVQSYGNGNQWQLQSKVIKNGSGVMVNNYYYACRYCGGTGLQIY